jgi:hypothetical protein
MKRVYNSFLWVISALLMLAVGGAGCKETAAAKKKEQVAVDLNLTPEYLNNIERSTIELPAKNDSATRKYEGVSLWRILDKAGLSSGKMKPKEIVKRYLVAQGADGFKVVFSLAELDTAFTHKEVLLADKVNGKELAADRGPYQLIAQDELRPTRNCYKIVKLTVYEADTEIKDEQ